MALGLPAASLRAQVSPRLERFAGRDTVVAAWLIARPGQQLDSLAARAARGGARVRRISRFARAVSVDVRGSAIADLGRMPGVRRVQALGTFIRPRPLAAFLVPVLDTLYGASWPYRQLNIPTLHDRGYRGAGVRIALLDAGFNTLHPLMAGATIVAQYDFVSDDSVVYDQPNDPPGEMAHGTGTWSLLAANAPGRLFGVVPDAEFLLAKTERTISETRVEEDNWVAGLEWAAANGAQIVSSSLGYLSFDGGFTYARSQLTGDIAVTTVAADSAAKLGVLVVVSAGNDGPQPGTIGTPADGDSVVAVGAVDSLGRVAGFSSRGPTSDGRVKPDVAAAGVAVRVARADTGVTTVNGTSYATPLVAGLAALVHGANPTALPVDLRQGLLYSASQFHGPDNNAGYGIPDGLRLYAFPAGLSPVALPDTLSSVTPLLRWFSGNPPSDAGPNVYFVRVATDSLMRNVVIDTFVTVNRFVPVRALPPGSRIWWRLVASSTLGVVESTTVRGPFLVPQWATLLSFASAAGTSIRDSLPTFVWRAPQVTGPPGPFTFDLDIYPASRSPDRAVVSARGLTDTTFVPPSPLERNLPFRWRVVARLASGDSQVVTSAGTFLVLDQTTPSATLLFQNFPNPFPSTATGQAATCIWFDLALEGHVQLAVYDLRGRLVRRLIPRPGIPAPLPAGRYGRPTTTAEGTCDPRFAWDGRDDDGNLVRAGVYVYRLSAPGFRDSRRIVWLGR